MVSQQSTSRIHYLKLQFCSSLKHFFCPPCLNLSSSIPIQKLLGESCCHPVFTNLQPSSVSLIIISVLGKTLWMWILSSIYMHLLEFMGDAAQTDWFKAWEYFTLKGVEEVWYYHHLLDFYFCVQLDASLKSLLPKGKMALHFQLCVWIQKFRWCVWLLKSKLVHNIYIWVFCP